MRQTPFDGEIRHFLVSRSRPAALLENFADAIEMKRQTDDKTFQGQNVVSQSRLVCAGVEE